MLNFSEKNIVITGATRGLGKELAEKFWQAGANLILVARTESALKSLHKNFLSTKKNNQHANVFSIDLSVAEQTEKLIQILQQKKIDILINNAAIQGPIGPVWENDWKQWQETLQVNLLSPIALCRAIIPAMLMQNNGKIINLSGGGAAYARPQFSAYAVAKSGLVRFSETLAEEVKNHSIDINCVAPGVMNTDFSEKNIQDQENNINHAADLCLFLASTQSDGLSGKLISAVWDPWKNFTRYIHEIKDSDIYTLRRIVPRDRGKNWEDAT
ncbi:MAG TPA: SDR family oxidoreductase [Gammaproteobacteria bacterium]|nr:SDR family oxidoreductase [Gammaproteobacteria bacterium]